jgi:hypothetical protein
LSGSGFASQRACSTMVNFVPGMGVPCEGEGSVSVSSPRTGTCRGALGHVGGGVTRRVGDGGCVVRGAWSVGWVPGCDGRVQWVQRVQQVQQVQQGSRAGGGSVAAGVAATRRATDDEQLSKALP